MKDLVLGADVGGTSIRVLVADTDGRRLAYASAGGGNPRSNGTARAAANLQAAVAGALDGLDPLAVRAAVVSMAGGEPADEAAPTSRVGDIIASSGIAVPVELIVDAEIAFASATTQPNGTVLLAGTGATGARIRDRYLEAISDGLGWLLGDHGSGFWLGREAVRAALAALGGVGPPTVLADSIPRRLLGSGSGGSAWQRRSELIASILANPPVALAALAPLVTEAEAAADTVASRICDRAADHLIRTIQDISTPEENTPLVLSGRVVAPPDSPVGKRVRTVAATHFGGEVIAATEPVIGAAWLAIRRALPHKSEAALSTTHKRLRTAS